jgi:hypothetical protein
MHRSTGSFCRSFVLAGAVLVLGSLAACASSPASLDASTPDAGALDLGTTDTGPAPFDAGVDAWIEPPPPPPGVPLALPVAPSATCMPTAAACDPVPVPIAAAGYRKDFYYPLAQYPEAMIASPADGGRVHVVATAGASGDVTAVSIRGMDRTALLDAGWLDWIHVWPETLVAGEPFWISFHSQSAELDASADLPVRVETAAGVALDTTLHHEVPRALISYVTPSDDDAALLVHLRNTDTASHTLARLVVDGRDVTDAACIADRTLAPGAATVWSVPACAPRATGSLWSVVVEWADAPPSVAGGRVLARHFPIETWPVEDECPLPGGNEENLAMHLAAGFDTFFLRGAYTATGCNAVTSDQVIAAAPARGVYAMPDEFLSLPAGVGAAEHVAARLLSDEGDSSRTDGHARMLAETAQASWSRSPTLATYIGGSRHRNNGTFAGVADLQGFDFYVAACAPHVTDFGSNPPLRAAYDYMRAVRTNSAPLPTWLYSQGLSNGWNRGANVYQPDPAELRVQAWSSVLAGAKGLMYFQTSLSMARGPAADTWAEISRVNHEVRALARVLREGDPTGTARASAEDVVVDAIASPDALVLAAIDVGATGVTDLLCATRLPPPHWQLVPQLTNLGVDLPAGLGVVDAFEVRADGVHELPAGATLDGRTVWIPSVSLDQAQPTRVFVLASRAAMRGEIAAALAP